MIHHTIVARSRKLSASRLKARVEPVAEALVAFALCGGGWIIVRGVWGFLA